MSLKDPKKPCSLVTQSQKSNQVTFILHSVLYNTDFSKAALRW